MEGAVAGVPVLQRYGTLRQCDGEINGRFARAGQAETNPALRGVPRVGEVQSLQEREALESSEV